MLAAVLTMKFDRDVLVHDMMSSVTAYAEIVLARQRRLSSLVVLHMPSDGLSARPPHVHVLCTTRVHRPAGWSEVHPVFGSEMAATHAAFRDEWRGFKAHWDTIPE